MGTKIFSNRNRVLWMATGTAILILASTSDAIARTERLSWSHPDPAQIARFEVHYGTVSRSYTSTLNMGKPIADQSGVFSYDLQVPDDLTIYVTVSAVDAVGVESVYSNQRMYPGLTTTAPPPTEPTPTPDPSLPPMTGTVWSEDFSGVAIGNAIPNWLNTDAGNSMVVRDDLFSVVNFGGNYVLSTQNAGTNIHSHYMGVDSATWSNYEYQGRMRTDAANGGLGVTAYSHYNQEDAYYRLRSYGGNSFELAMHPESIISCADPDTGIAPEPGRWYQFRLRVDSSGGTTLIYAKVWADGSAEPADWQASCSDRGSGRLTSGTVGVWSMSSGLRYWDDLRVFPLGGTGSGDLPLAPPDRPTIIMQ